MWVLAWFGLTLGLGCRTPPPEKKTAELRTIGDVDAMAEAWCDVLYCRDGYFEAFSTLEACVTLYQRYWGDANVANNQRDCFTDVEETRLCTQALEETDCGERTPAICVPLIQCQLPSDDEDTG